MPIFVLLLLPNQSDQAYWLLFNSLKKSKKAGIVRFATHSKEHIALIRQINNGLALCTLYYPEEIKTFNELPMKPDPKHLDLAISLIEQQTIEFHPEKYSDRYTDALVTMIEGKQPEPLNASPSHVTDLMEALRQSIEKAKGQKSA